MDTLLPIWVRIKPFRYCTLSAVTSYGFLCRSKGLPSTLQSDCFAYFAYSVRLSLRGSAMFRDCTAGLNLCSEFHEPPNHLQLRYLTFGRDCLCKLIYRLPRRRISSIQCLLIRTETLIIRTCGANQCSQVKYGWNFVTVLLYGIWNLVVYTIIIIAGWGIGVEIIQSIWVELLRLFIVDVIYQNKSLLCVFVSLCRRIKTMFTDTIVNHADIGRKIVWTGWGIRIKIE